MNLISYLQLASWFIRYSSVVSFSCVHIVSHFFYSSAQKTLRAKGYVWKQPNEMSLFILLQSSIRWSAHTAGVKAWWVFATGASSATATSFARIASGVAMPAVPIATSIRWRSTPHGYGEHAHTPTNTPTHSHTHTNSHTQMEKVPLQKL